MPQGFVARRQFLQFLAASPLFAGLNPLRLMAQEPASIQPDRSGGSLENLYSVIQRPDQALDVFDFERVAEHKLPPAHWGYLATGTDGDETLRANRTAFDKVYLRALRMVDSANIDTSLELLGQRLSSPIVLCPVGSQRAFHEDGEAAVARAARSRDHLQILSNVSTTSLEDVMKERGAPVWQQLYPTSNFAVGKAMVQRAERAGSPTLVLTVDLNSDSKRVTMSRYIQIDQRLCASCHDQDDPNAYLQRKPMYDDTGAQVAEFLTADMTWDYIRQLREICDMQIVIKGIVTAEDARSAIEAGADAVFVSNHGGRAEASGWGSLDSLPEVVAAVEGRVPVMVDSGFRRGTDIYKALAMGADAVCIGRPYIWGLAAFGQGGVEAVLDMLQAELELVMGQMGTPSLARIGPTSIGRH